MTSNELLLQWAEKSKKIHNTDSVAGTWINLSQKQYWFLFKLWKDEGRKDLLTHKYNDFELIHLSFLDLKIEGVSHFTFHEHRGSNSWSIRWRRDHDSM